MRITFLEVRDECLRGTSRAEDGQYSEMGMFLLRLLGSVKKTNQGKFPYCCNYILIRPPPLYETYYVCNECKHISNTLSGLDLITVIVVNNTTWEPPLYLYATWLDIKQSHYEDSGTENG